MSHPEKPLDQLVEINPQVKLEKGVAYPFIPMEEISPGRRYVKAKSYRVAGGGAKFCHGDTLFARITPCLENGKIAQYVSTPSQIAFGSTEYWVFRSRKGISDPAYVFYLANSEIIRKPAEKSMVGASGRQRADIKAVENVSVPAPPLPIQRRIASILSAYDDLIENNTRRIAILEEMARRIYEEWFVKFKFPGHEKVKMVDSELGKIPEGWKVRLLGDLASDIRQSIQPNMVDPETPYVGLEHIPRRSIALSEWGKATDVQSTKIIFQERDILFGKIRPYFHKVAVAPIGGVTSSDSIVIRTLNQDFYPIVLATVSSDAFVAHATQTSNGTKMPRANWNVLTQYPIAIPPNPLLGGFNSFITNVVTAVKNFTLKNRNLHTTRDFLLPKLISGEIDVSKLPEPEEAAA